MPNAGKHTPPALLVQSRPFPVIPPNFFDRDFRLLSGSRFCPPPEE